LKKWKIFIRKILTLSDCLTVYLNNYLIIINYSKVNLWEVASHLKVNSHSKRSQILKLLEISLKNVLKHRPKFQRKFFPRNCLVFKEPKPSWSPCNKEGNKGKGSSENASSLEKFRLKTWKQQKNLIRYRVIILRSYK
jgi:hypothetical protein